MKVLRVISSMKPETGGPCQGIRNSIPALNELGIQNEVLSFDSPEEEFLGSDNFIIHPLGPANNPYSYSPKLSKWLQNNLNRFDVIIVHGLWQHNSYGTYRAFKHYCKSNLYPPKLFVMPHGMLDPYFQKASSRRLKAVRNYFFWKLIEHQVIEGADGLLFTCEQELLLARESFSPYNPKVEINVGYGIEHPPALELRNKEDFYKKCPEVVGKGFLLFLSRIHPKKGVDLLVRSYIRLKEEGQEIPDLVIAGPGMESVFGQSLKKSCNHPNIHFPGMLRGFAKWGAFYSCEALVLPSHQENFGIAVVEALACRKPVLISNQVNIFKEVLNGGGGLVAIDSEEGTYELLKEWISLSAGQKELMKDKAYEVFQSHYTIQQAAKGLIRALKSSPLGINKKNIHHGIISHKV